MEYKKAHSWKQLTECAKNLTPDSESYERREEKSNFSTKRARLLLGQFRSGEAHDPEAYIHAVAAVLSQYPDDIVLSVTDPRTGLARVTKWLPTVSEVYQSCEDRMRSHLEYRRRKHHCDAQLDDRQKFDDRNASRPSMDELRARYGKNWGLTGKTADENADEEKAKKARAQQEFARSVARVSADWGRSGAAPPTVGGIPISRELAAMMEISQ